MALALSGVPTSAAPPQGGAPGGLIVDFYAARADGTPVTDLTPADVTIRIGGKQRTIQSLTLKKVEAGAAPAAGAPAASSLPAPFFTNAASAPAGGGGNHRSILMLVDTDSIQPGTEKELINGINKLLDGLTTGDRVALSTAPRDTLQIAFTDNLARVRTAVASLKSTRPASVSNAEALCRTRDTLVMLQGMLETIPGRDTPMSAILLAASLSTPGQASSASAGTCEVTKEHYEEIKRGMATARANLYVVQADSGAQGRNDGLENLVGTSGAGSVWRVTGDGFSKPVLAESSTYWVATVAPDSGDRPGQQRLEVRAAKDGVNIRVRPEFAFGRAGAAGPAGGGGGGKVSLRDMVVTKAPFSDLQLRAVAVVQRGAADKMNALVFVEPVDPAVKLTGMHVGFYQGEKGSSIQIPEKTLAASPVPVALPLNVGEYRIRVAASESGGKSGAVDVMVNTELSTVGPLRISSILVVGPKGGAMSPRLLFAADDTKMGAMIEMYANPADLAKGLQAKFEISDSEKGKAMQTVLPGAQPTNEPDKFQLSAEMDISKLAPGDYVLRAIVNIPGQPENIVWRTFRKAAK